VVLAAVSSPRWSQISFHSMMTTANSSSGMTGQMSTTSSPNDFDDMASSGKFVFL